MCSEHDCFLQRRDYFREKIKTDKRVNKCLSEYLTFMVENECEDFWPDLRNAMIYAASIAFASASCERYFSTLSFVKNILITTMVDSRLLPLMIGCYESDIVHSLDDDVIIAKVCFQ